MKCSQKYSVMLPNITMLRSYPDAHEHWPGITLPAPTGQWGLSAYARVAVALTHSGTKPVTVYRRVDNAGADGPDQCVTHSLALRPGQTGSLSVPLKRTADDTLGGKLFRS